MNRFSYPQAVTANKLIHNYSNWVLLSHRCSGEVASCLIGLAGCVGTGAALQIPAWKSVRSCNFTQAGEANITGMIPTWILVRD